MKRTHSLYRTLWLKITNNCAFVHMLFVLYLYCLIKSSDSLHHREIDNHIVKEMQNRYR